MIYWIIGTILNLLFIILLMTKIAIVVGYQNGFYLRIKLPFKTIDPTKMQTQNKPDEKTKNVEVEPYDDFVKGANQYKKFFAQNRPKIKKILTKAKKSLVVEKFYFKYHYGFEDAAFCAIAFGIVNGFVYNLYAMTCHLFKVKNVNINIAPDFNNSLKIIEFESIIKIRIANIISIIIKAIPLLIKFKKLNKTKSSDAVK